MSKSPYLPPQIKQYMKDHQIEDLVSESINSLLAAQSNDPYAFLSQYFENLAPSVITITGVSGTQILNSEQLPTIQVYSRLYRSSSSTLVTKGRVINSDPTFTSILRQRLRFSNNYCTYDHYLGRDGDSNGQMQQEHDYYNGKGIKTALQVLNTKINELIQNKLLSEQKSIDETLSKYLAANPKHLNIIQPISFAIPSLISEVLNRTLVQTYNLDFGQAKSAPKLFVNLLQGSKLVGSKCKVFRYLLVVHDTSDALGTFILVQTVVANLRKAIVSGKQGEAALKFYPDGTMICTADTIADNLKIVESAIDQAGAKDKVGIGLVWMAETFFNQDQKKYELENPKQLLDTDQLIDYYFKLCTDRQGICYMEDPIQPDDELGWKRLITKFQDHRVKIGSRKLYATPQLLKKYTEVVTKESHPNLSEQEINDSNAKILNLHYAFLKPYEFHTYSQFQQHARSIMNKKPTTSIILGDNLTDTTDTSIIDLGHAMPNTMINISGPLKYEKILKYSRMIEINPVSQQ